MVLVFDLDDTLYDEIDFVKSGFKEIAKYLQIKDAYAYMMHIFEQEGSGQVFDRLIEDFQLHVPLQKLIEIYRFHRPDINLPKESLNWLQYARQHKTALISDGHYIMQQNKFNALGLDQTLIEYPVFTDLYHTKKPEEKPYRMVMKHFNQERIFVYISDNPAKDFIAPIQLGWHTVRYRNPQGIYNNIDNTAAYEISRREELIDILEII